MKEYGLEIYSQYNIDLIRLRNLSVCNSGQGDISFYKINEFIDRIKTRGDMYCDSAIEYDYQGTSEDFDFTPEYCTASCADIPI